MWQHEKATKDLFKKKDIEEVKRKTKGVENCRNCVWNAKVKNDVRLAKKQGTAKKKKGSKFREEKIITRSVSQ